MSAAAAAGDRSEGCPVPVVAVLECRQSNSKAYEYCPENRKLKIKMCDTIFFFFFFVITTL